MQALQIEPNFLANNKKFHKSHCYKQKSLLNLMSQDCFIHQHVLKTMANLINSSTRTSNLVRKLYHSSLSNTILSYSYPLPKIDRGQNRLVWHHSSLGEYQVKKAKNLPYLANCHNDPNEAKVLGTPNEVWSSIWKVNCQ